MTSLAKFQTILAELLGRHTAKHCAAKTVKNETDVEDVFQTVALKMLGRENSIENAELCTNKSIRNTAIDPRRSTSVRSEYEGQFADSATAVGDSEDD